MKRLAGTAALLFLCGCGRQFTGLGSVDLKVTSITFHDSHPATITGILPAGKPAGFAEAVDDPLVLFLGITCRAENDTSGLAEVNETVGYSLSYGVSSFPGEGTALVEMSQEGMAWLPDYSYIQENGERMICATARLTNLTVQTWQADTVRFLDPDANLVTAATGRITIRQGGSVIPWWNAPAERPEYVIRYGWPVPGRWNQLQAVRCPGKGTVESWTNQVYERGDTLFFPADSLLRLSLDWDQEERGYQCFLTAESLTDETLQWCIQWPDRLPRGARVEPGPGMIQVQPGQSVTVLYKEVY